MQFRTNQFVLFVSLIIYGTSFGQVPYFDGAKWGFVNEMGEVFTSPRYDSLPTYFAYLSEDILYKTSLENNILLVDGHGKILGKEYDDYTVLQIPLIRIEKNRKYGIYNLQQQKSIVDPQYDQITLLYASDHKFFIAEKDSLKTILNIDGSSLIPWDSYQSFEISKIENIHYLIGRLEGAAFKTFDVKGNPVENLRFINPFPDEQSFSFPDEPRIYTSQNDKNGKILIKNNYNKTIYKGLLPDSIQFRKLLFDGKKIPERWSTIIITERDEKLGLYDLLFEEKVLKPEFNSIEALKTRKDVVLIKKADLYGVLLITEEEDEDYYTKRIKITKSKVTFSNIHEFNNSKNSYILFELPNKYQCFASFEHDEKKIKFYLPQKILKKYKLNTY